MYPEPIEPGSYYVNERRGHVREVTHRFDGEYANDVFHIRTYRLRDGEAVRFVYGVRENNLQNWADRKATPEEIAILKLEDGYRMAVEIEGSGEFSTGLYAEPLPALPKGTIPTLYLGGRSQSGHTVTKDVYPKKIKKRNKPKYRGPIRVRGYYVNEDLDHVREVARRVNVSDGSKVYFFRTYRLRDGKALKRVFYAREDTIRKWVDRRATRKEIAPLKRADADAIVAEFEARELKKMEALEELEALEEMKRYS